MTAYIISFKYNVFWFFSLLSLILSHGSNNQRIVYIGDAINQRTNQAFLSLISINFPNDLFIDITNCSAKIRYKELKASNYVLIQGGNTVYMLNKWKRMGFDKVLEKLRKEKRMPVVIGISAGGFWMFSSGITDSVPGEWRVLDGYNWINKNIVFHANDSEVRHKQTKLEFFNQYFKWTAPKNIRLSDDSYIKVEY